MSNINIRTDLFILFFRSCQIPFNGFLLVDDIESAVDCPLLDEAHLADENLIAWSYYVYVYDSVDEMRALLAQ